MDLITLALAKSYSNKVGSTIQSTNYNYDTGELTFNTINGDWTVPVNNGMNATYKQTLDNIEYSTTDNKLKINGSVVVTQDDLATEGGGDSSITLTQEEYEALTEEEQIVGCWINGKPIYRKVIHIGQFPSTTGTFYTKHNIDNLNVATKVYGIGIDNDRVSYPLPWSTNTNNAAVSIFMGRTTIGIVTATDQSTRFTDSYAIVEYTKTIY